MIPKLIGVGLLALVATASVLGSSPITVRVPDCSSAPDTGPCKAGFQRFFYNTTSGQCESFIYGGCQGNRNRFKSLKKCVAKCPPAAVCTVEGAVYTECASACPPPTCNDGGSGGGCIALCVQGCACPSGQVVDQENNRCVLPESCPRTCSVKGQRYFDSTVGQCVPCTGSCHNPNPICTLGCSSGCGCPVGTVLNKNGSECIHPRTCPRVCQHNQQTHHPGDKWNCTEGGECKFCLCLANGYVAMHDQGCPKKMSCQLPNGTEIFHRTTVHTSSCISCTCNNGDLQCSIQDCIAPACSNPIVPEGQCCAVCPTSCQVSNGTIIENGQSYKSDPCTTCTCVDGQERCASVSCRDLTDQCQWGSFHYPGECCARCNPPPSCNYVKCARPSCAFPSVVVPADPASQRCCDTCGCKFDSKVYHIGQEFTFSCNQCECLPGGSVRCAPIAGCQ